MAPFRGESIMRSLFTRCILLCLFAPSAMAYIDPGSGSFLLQGLVAGILGLGVTLKLYWGKLFGRHSRGKSDPGDED
jgi:hypothetical protein